MFDVIVVGGGCAGMTAAIYLQRAEKSTLVLESTALGGQITSTGRIENFPGLPGISGVEFGNRMAEQVLSFGGQLEPVEVQRITPQENAFKVETTDGESMTARSVILACGTAHRHLGLPREETLNGVSYCAICDGAFYKGKDVAVVGGGNAAVQSALSLAALCRKVTLIHRREGFRSEPILLERLKALPNVVIRTGGVVSALQGEDQLTGVELTFGEKKETLSVEGLFVAIGQIPKTKAFEGFVDLDEEGYLAAGEDCKTSLEGVFAAGDCRQKPIRQLATAAGDGAVAGLMAARYLEQKGY